MKNGVYSERVPNAGHDARTDEELMLDLAGGQQDALGPLYSRYAGLIFHLAAHSLDRPVAEELVQEVFLTIWRSAGAFDPEQGAFRPWLLRLAHWRILNELRHRRRQPPQQPRQDADDDLFARLLDDQPGPEERAWQREHRQVLQSALETLPPEKRQAVALAFLEDMTHEQVAQALDVPLGTAKTRIRTGLQLLRLRLAPIAASLLGVCLAIVGSRYLQAQLGYDRDERAIDLLASSELVTLRLAPVSADLPAGAHANYRGRAGDKLAVLTAEDLPSLSNGGVYQAWVRHGDQWTSLGTFAPSADGTVRLITEGSDLTSVPEAVQITVEPASGSQTPSGTVVLVWPTP
jgi:RNA polymerase sigma-70 factor, ECF subfamily